MFNPQSDNSEISSIGRNIADIIAGNISPVCGICRHIPREESWTHPSSVIKEIDKLKCAGSAGKYTLEQCPECQKYYLYSYSEECEDMMMYYSIYIRRLSSSAAKEYLPENLKNNYDKDLPKLRAQYGRDLVHHSEFMRAEAAWSLASIFLLKNEYDMIAGLLKSDDVIICRNALEALSCENIPVKTFETLLTGLLDSDDKGIVKYSSALLNRLYIEEKNYGRIRFLLTHKNNTAVSMCIGGLWQDAKHDKFEIDPVIDIVKSLAKSKDAGIRSSASYALESHGPQNGPGSKSEFFLQGLSNPDPEVKIQACYYLSRLAKDEKDISEAIPFSPDFSLKKIKA